MRVVYIAGPFRAPNSWEIEQNVRRAEALALEVWKLGAACICPHTNTRFYQGAAPDQVWLEGDLELLRRCDAILLVRGWEQSHGAMTELKYAMSKHLKVLYSLEDTRQWLAEAS